MIENVASLNGLLETKIETLRMLAGCPPTRRDKF